MLRLPWADVTLRPIEASDVERLHKWQNDAKLRDMTMGYRFPLSRERVADWIVKLGRSDTTPTRAIYAVCYKSECVGTVQLYNIDYISRTASIGSMVVPSKDQLAGIGQVAILIIIHFGFKGLNLNRLEGETLASNRPTVNALERCGFQLEGRRRHSFFADGIAHDTLIYAILRDEFKVVLPPQASLLCGKFDLE
jgi:RimJ/RimL family protein N-acetyltransferase